MIGTVFAYINSSQSSGSQVYATLQSQAYQNSNQNLLNLKIFKNNFLAIVYYRVMCTKFK